MTDHKNMNKTFTADKNFSIDPEIKRIRKAKFSIADITGLLDKYDIEIS